MNSLEWKPLISAYFDGVLSHYQQAAAEKLLAENPECRDYLKQLQKLSGTLGAWKEEQLSPDAETKILSAVKRRGQMQTNSWKPAVVVLAGLLIVGRLAYNVTQQDLQHSNKPKAQLEIVPSRAQQPAVHQSQPLTVAQTAVARSSGPTQYEPYYLISSYGVGSSVEDAVDFNTEEYATIVDNQFHTASETPLSTFSIDVDTASYSNVRRFLSSGQMPPKDAVRIEEMINYFTYDYPQPEQNQPFSVTTKLAHCPWNSSHQLLLMGIKGRTPDATHQLPPGNLVFLIDVSGSMESADKLPLLKEGLKMMVRQLRPEDKVSIVVYAGNAGKVLDPTPGDQKDKIIAAIDNLQAGGSTAGRAGIQLAYQTAKENFLKAGNNRVVLATDGDFNVGVSSTSELVRLIEDERQNGIFLTVLGFGQGNLKDSRMEQLADKGNGNYYYIDNAKEARKVLVSELGSTLFTIAKDVKIQIEFNPAAVKAYRLVGYENRVMAKEDFNDDKKDAGEIGAGHTVTALYELVPVESSETFGNTDPLKYQKAEAVASQEIMTIKLRYKEPDAETSQLITKTLNKQNVQGEPTGDFAWAAAVAEFGMLLRDSEFKGQSSYDDVLKKARANTGEDKFGIRSEFISLVEAAQATNPGQPGNIEFK